MKKYKKSKEKKREILTEPSVLPTFSNPGTAEEMVNFYGTYEIQRTADTDNQYPAIAQGFNKKIIKHDCENPENN
ncbi:MAG: hypothetical protein IKD04_07540 [Clostridia bacterium]|nr:hypothetical protein [Clostridia bacterium]